MGNNGHAGASAELAVAVDLMRIGYDVFRAESPAASCDLIAIADMGAGEVVRVEVRTAMTRKDGSLTAGPRRTDRCDMYALVCGERIEYFAPRELLLNSPCSRPGSEWRLEAAAALPKAS